MKTPTIRHFATASLLVALFAASALAGPPLLCHIFDIGNAKSLPWVGDQWDASGNNSFDTRNLAADTLAILDNDSAVLVHMETLRRAAVYGQKDALATKQLLIRLIARSNSAASDTPAAALAMFDAGYFAETLSETHWVFKNAVNPAQGFDGYALIKKALKIRTNDPQMEFAAALVTLDGPAVDHQDHAQKTLAGAKIDALLARNLSVHFRGAQSETMAEMITRTSNTKVARQ